MARRSRFFIALSLAGGMLASPALADVAPPDACQAADVGKACNNATKGGAMDQPGTCEAATCTRPTPTGSMSYDCFTCKPSTSAKKDDGGCSATGRGQRAMLALVPLLALGFLRARRRRQA